MNIFILSKDPHEAVKLLHNKHVVKMTLETAQLLCGVHESAPYKRTHYNHPCAKWVRTSKQNYLWLCSYGKAIAKEYTKRYGKVHKSEAVIQWCFEHDPNLPDVGLTEFPQCMPDEFKGIDTVQAYIKYYEDKTRNWR